MLRSIGRGIDLLVNGKPYRVRYIEQAARARASLSQLVVFGSSYGKSMNFLTT